MNQQHLAALNTLATGNRDLLRLAGTGVCTSCSKHVDEAEIITWIDDRKTPDSPGDFTAVCPHCGADALIPDCTATLVAALHDYWFSTKA
jgi:hypothetical protein